MGTIQVMIRTRIAPSPTGYPHIGTIYQALFDYAFAKKNEGRFIVRIEDTDRARFVEDAEDKIFSSLDWFGLVEDESSRKGGEFGPYRQSERLDIYKKYAEQLIHEGHAYYCFCTKERLDKVRQEQQDQGKQPMYDKLCRTIPLENSIKRVESGEGHVVRMKIPENTDITFHDEMRGDITFHSSTIDDQVIVKGDGFPTYHLAVVVDDHEMQITHVLRGEEWLSSTPKHFLLYEFFKWERPLFFHTPVLRNPDKSKLSKRQGHTNVDWYKDEGFLPEAILNYLALMGWSHPEEKEKFSMEEFVSLVELKNIKPVGPIFDIVKLTWLNGDYIMQMSNGELLSRIKNFDKNIVELVSEENEALAFIEIAKSRMKTLKEFRGLVEPFLKPQTFDLSIQQKELKVHLHQTLSSISDWNMEEIKNRILQEYIFSKKYKFPALYEVIIGQNKGLPIAETFSILGKERTLKLLS